ncbi:hypothetical protein MKX03_005187, partial [Papaver bracteatum]
GSLESSGSSKNGSSRNAESDEEDRGLGPTHDKEDEPVDNVEEEEDDDIRINMTSEATNVREIHYIESFVESGHDEKNDFDGVKVDVQGTNPDTDLIRQDDMVEMLENMQEVMLTIK